MLDSSAAAPDGAGVRGTETVAPLIDLINIRFERQVEHYLRPQALQMTIAR